MKINDSSGSTRATCAGSSDPAAVWYLAAVESIPQTELA